ncbi:hypothetical protein [Kribbella sp. NPDC051770]|uniref:sunset domain-containing protein n=1 Tax=Kribbella sp. NPDC051770 TaxID=3155413 RepID=UPI00343C6465
MSDLARSNWPWELLAFALGAVITWFLLKSREPAEVPAPAAEDEEKVLVSAGAPLERSEQQASPPPMPKPKPSPLKPSPPEAFSQRMDPAETTQPTLFDGSGRAVVPGRYGPGSADAVEHQSPPDGFTIKGNAQSMLFHTPDSPYYGRTKPEVWFRTEADAEQAGFTKYVRKPRKSPGA